VRRSRWGRRWLDGDVLAAAKPDRTSALILFTTSAKYLASSDYPIGIPGEAAKTLIEQVDQLWRSSRCPAARTTSGLPLVRQAGATSRWKTADPMP
jgi:hypothetical protein